MASSGKTVQADGSRGGSRIKVLFLPSVTETVESPFCVSLSAYGATCSCEHAPAATGIAGQCRRQRLSWQERSELQVLRTSGGGGHCQRDVGLAEPWPDMASQLVAVQLLNRLEQFGCDTDLMGC